MWFKLIVLSFWIAFVAAAQIQIVDKPADGFEKRIQAAVDDIWLINTHEHMETEEERLAKADIDFMYMFRNYPEFDLVSSGMDPFMKDLIFNPRFSETERWNLIKPFWQAMRNTAYGRVVLLIARDLYGVEELNEQTFPVISAKIRAGQTPGLYRRVLRDKARIDLTIQDLGHRKFDPEFFVHIEKFDQFIDVKSGAYIRETGGSYGIDVRTLADYEAALAKAFQNGLDYGMVGVKSVLAYSRILQYENVAREQAEQLFDAMMSREAAGKSYTFAEVKPLQDYMMHRVLTLVQQHKLPIQFHTGLHAGNSNNITHSMPTHLINLFMEFPGVNFCLLHSSYPYGGELSTLAKNFPNVFIDMAWSHIISPSYSERYLHEWLETVPANKIMAFGGDYCTIEGTWAHSRMARSVVAKVLTEKVRTGYFSEKEAIEIAKRLLRENAMEVYKLQGHSRAAENIRAFTGSGFLAELWDVHQTNKGFIRNWMVIGSFPLGAPWGSLNNPKGFDTAYPPELEIDLARTYQGMAGHVQWQKVIAPESGYLDFRLNLSPTDAVVGYAYAEVFSPLEQTVKMTFGSNDGAKVWVNDVNVYSRHLGRPATPDQDILEAKLRKGTNRILVKVENWGGHWGMYMRLLDLNGELRIKTF
jgi:uncharacterized protein